MTSEKRLMANPPTVALLCALSATAPNRIPISAAICVNDSRQNAGKMQRGTAPAV